MVITVSIGLIRCTLAGTLRADNELARLYHTATVTSNPILSCKSAGIRIQGQMVLQAIKGVTEEFQGGEGGGGMAPWQLSRQQNISANTQMD